MNAAPARTEPMVKSDQDLRRDVEAELEYEPSIDSGEIGVAVKDGIVTLAGSVRTYVEKWKAQRVVERIEGVRGIVNDIEVHPVGERSDSDIARSAVEALKWNVLVPSDKIKVEVEHGWLTLKGEVEYDYQRRAAERAVRNLPGIRNVTNLVTVKPRGSKPDPETVKAAIRRAMERQAEIEASKIDVEVDGSVVTLSGSVHSWAERYEVEKAAWAAPGVTEVRNRLSVMPIAA